MVDGEQVEYSLEVACPSPSHVDHHDAMSLLSSRHLTVSSTGTLPNDSATKSKLLKLVASTASKSSCKSNVFRKIELSLI